MQRLNHYRILEHTSITHVVELFAESAEVRAFTGGLYATVDGQVHSKWQRDARANRKKPVDENGDEIEEEEEVVAMWRPLNRLELVKRACDNEPNLEEQIKQFECIERPNADDLIS